MPKPSKATPEGRERRLRAFKHNSYLDYTAMTGRHMFEIIGSDTATQNAKNIANQIMALNNKLSDALKTRVD